MAGAQVGPGAGLHPVTAEGAGGLAVSSGGVCQGAERHHLHAECRRGTGENVGLADERPDVGALGY